MGRALGELVPPGGGEHDVPPGGHGGLDRIAVARAHRVVRAEQRPVEVEGERLHLIAGHSARRAEEVGCGSQPTGQAIEGDGQRVVAHRRPGDDRRRLSSSTKTSHIRAPAITRSSCGVGRAAGGGAEARRRSAAPLVVADRPEGAGDAGGDDVLPLRRRPVRMPRIVHHAAGRCPRLSRSSSDSRRRRSATASLRPRRSSVAAARLASSSRSHPGSLHGTPTAVADGVGGELAGHVGIAGERQRRSGVDVVDAERVTGEARRAPHADAACPAGDVGVAGRGDARSSTTRRARRS